MKVSLPKVKHSCYFCSLENKDYTEKNCVLIKALCVCICREHLMELYCAFHDELLYNYDGEDESYESKQHRNSGRFGDNT